MGRLCRYNYSRSCQVSYLCCFRLQEVICPQKGFLNGKLRMAFVKDKKIVFSNYLDHSRIAQNIPNLMRNAATDKMAPRIFSSNHAVAAKRRHAVASMSRAFFSCRIMTRVVVSSSVIDLRCFEINRQLQKKFSFHFNKSNFTRLLLLIVIDAMENTRFIHNKFYQLRDRCLF